MTVIATIIAKPGAEASLRREVLVLIPTSCKELDSLNYDLHQAADLCP